MTEYKTVQFKLSDLQLSRVRSAIRNESDVTIQIGLQHISDGKGNLPLNLTKAQMNKIKRLTGTKQVRLLLSTTQLKSIGKENTGTAKALEVTHGKDNKKEFGMEAAACSLPTYSDRIPTKVKELALAVTPAEKAKINSELVKLMALLNVDESKVQSGKGLGAIFKLALPFAKTVLPKVLGTLGLAAATGALSGATHKATSGKGLKRVGGAVKLNKKELTKLMKLGNACECKGIVNPGFVKRMNKDIKMQKGGWIAPLIAGLAGTLLPALFGKGLSRAGSKD